MMVFLLDHNLKCNLVLERQLDECLESLEREREEKMSLRRELGELHDREHLPRTPTRSAIDATMIPAPDSPASDSSAEAKNLRDRLRNQGEFRLVVSIFYRLF